MSCRQLEIENLSLGERPGLEMKILESSAEVIVETIMCICYLKEGKLERKTNEFNIGCQRCT